MPSYELRIPQMGEGLQEARLLRFLKRPGDIVARDEPIYEMETDKATVEIESPVAGQTGTVAGRGGSDPADRATVGLVSCEAGAAISCDLTPAPASENDSADAPCATSGDPAAERGGPPRSAPMPEPTASTRRASPAVGRSAGQAPARKMSTGTWKLGKAQAHPSEAKAAPAPQDLCGSPDVAEPTHVGLPLQRRYTTGCTGDGGSYRRMVRHRTTPDGTPQAEARTRLCATYALFAVRPGAWPSREGAPAILCTYAGNTHTPADEHLHLGHRRIAHDDDLVMARVADARTLSLDEFVTVAHSDDQARPSRRGPDVRRYAGDPHQPGRFWHPACDSGKSCTCDRHRVRGSGRNDLPYRLPRDGGVGLRRVVAVVLTLITASLTASGPPGFWPRSRPESRPGRECGAVRWAL